MNIGELAKSAGVKVATVRFYERSGLLREPARRPSGYRIYGASDRARLRFIRRAQSLGFSLADIRAILDLRDRGQRPCSSVVALGQRHLEETDRRIRELQQLRRGLARALARWQQSPGDGNAGDICALIEQLADERPARRTRSGPPSG